MHGVDLHTHSNISDGTLTPQQLVEAAVEKCVHTLALTDHDTMDGLKIAEEAAQNHKIKIIPGVEISSQWSRPATKKILWCAYCGVKYAKFSALRKSIRTTKKNSC